MRVLGLLYGNKLWIKLINVRNMHYIIIALEVVAHGFHY